MSYEEINNLGDEELVEEFAKEIILASRNYTLNRDEHFLRAGALEKEILKRMGVYEVSDDES